MAHILTMIKAYRYWLKAIKLHGKSNVKMVMATRISKELPWMYWEYPDGGE